MPPPIAPERRRGYRAGMGATILSLIMLAGVALTVGGVSLIRKKQDARRGWLMIAAAIVMFGNVLIRAAPIGWFQ